MSRLTPRYRILVVVVLVQVAALLGVAMLHGARLAAGTQVRVSVHAVDPLDLARGAYTTITYDFESLHVPPGRGDVYVILGREHGQAVWKATRVVDDPSKVGSGTVWIRLPRTSDGKRIDASAIAAFYASAEQARVLGDKLTTSGGVARLSLDRRGRPTLVDVTAQ